jgi:hypothetical protein
MGQGSTWLSRKAYGGDFSAALPRNLVQLNHDLDLYKLAVGRSCQTSPLSFGLKASLSFTKHISATRRRPPARQDG